MTPVRRFETPRESGLGLSRIASRSGLSISLLPNGCLFAIEHEHPGGKIQINQIQGSPLDGGIGRLYLRIGGTAPTVVEAVGPGAQVEIATAADRFDWLGTAGDIRHRVTLRLDPERSHWFWRVEVTNTGIAAADCDAILVQDLGLGNRGFVMSNEAYASQYIDHQSSRTRAAGRS